MKRLWAVAVGAVLLGGLIAIPHASASGGGGCPPPITSERATTVVIRNFCFGPTVVHVRAGETVTWLNKDVPHTVTGANRAWGSYRSLKTDKAATWRFDRPGVYPYYCVLHVGMIGSVVVGGGSSLTAADAIGRRDVRRVSTLETSRAEISSVPEAPRATEPDLTTVVAVGAITVAALFASARLRAWLMDRRARWEQGR